MSDKSNEGTRWRLLRDVVVFRIKLGMEASARHHADPGVARGRGPGPPRATGDATMVHAVLRLVNVASTRSTCGAARGPASSVAIRGRAIMATSRP